MLPDVNVEERNKVLGSVRDKVLVLRVAEHHLSLLLVEDEPAPATAHDRSCFFGEDFDEVFKSAEAFSQVLVRNGTFFGHVAVSLWR